MTISTSTVATAARMRETGTKSKPIKSCSWPSKVDRPYDHLTSEQTNISQEGADNAGRDYISNCPVFQ